MLLWTTALLLCVFFREADAGTLVQTLNATTFSTERIDVFDKPWDNLTAATCTSAGAFSPLAALGRTEVLVARGFGFSSGSAMMSTEDIGSPWLILHVRPQASGDPGHIRSLIESAGGWVPDCSYAHTRSSATNRVVTEVPTGLTAPGVGNGKKS